MIIVIIKLTGMLVSVFLFTACQSTESKIMVEPLLLKSTSYNTESVDNITVDKLSILSVTIKEPELVPPSTETLTRFDKDMLNQEKVNQQVSSLLNQQVCRDNVEVTYRVMDQNSVSGLFPAKIQAQAVILSLSQDYQDIKLRATGWFTNNENLQKWQPYLKKPPLAKTILLKIGSEFWDSKSHWYLCGVN